ncbi:MAG: LacI family DNA-binding transcriptional regulator [Actinomycetaceae bacterium]|nr:LacI family DNA-binding transcriptional regulator [Actinomycetaceae bacterium]
MGVTLADIAQRAGVSTAAASLVLSGQYQGRVSEKRAESIRQIAEEMQYVRNDLAQGLRTKTTRTLGFVTDTVATTPYAVDMIAAATAEARAAGYLLMLIETGGDRRTLEDAFRNLRSRHVDGIAFAPMYHHEVALPEDSGSDVIVVNGYPANRSITSAIPDEVQGAYDATTFLLDHGHRRIAYISESSSIDAGPLRIEGFRKAFETKNLPVSDDLIVHTETAYHDRIDAEVAALLRSHRPPTAFFCFNDATAMGVYRTAARLGLSIPHDISVVGFDNLELLATNVAPMLTTVQLPHRAMAQWGIQTLIEWHEGGLRQINGSPIRFACPLVVRDSVAIVRS